MPKFFVKTNQINNNQIEIIGEDVKHITQVLRAKKGEKLIICNIDNNLNYSAKIEQITMQSVLCTILEKLENHAESKIEVTIFQGLPKADKMEYIIQKNTELGVKKIVPVIMKRCIVKWEEKGSSKKIERWQKIAFAAAKQSGRDAIPKVENAITLNQLEETMKSYDLMLVAYENEKANTLKAQLKSVKSFENMKIGIIIGPEGGIDIEEVEKLTRQGAKIITLGNRILRTETASIMVISNIMYEYEM